MATKATEFGEIRQNVGVKTRTDMTYNVLGGTLNLTQPSHTPLLERVYEARRRLHAIPTLQPPLFHGFLAGCAGKTVRSLENACHT